MESITPNQGPTACGTPVTITGSGFVSPATVTIGSAATEVVVHSETEITAKTAATSVGPAEVVVSDENGTSTLGPSYNYVSPPLITLNPVNQVVTAGEDATFIAAASGTPSPSVQWEVSTNGGTTWANDTTDEGNATTTLTVASTAGENGYEYRAVFKNVVSEATSNPATLTVKYAPVITDSPVSKGVIVGQDAVFTASASGNPAPSVQWQVSTDFEKTWTNDTTDPGRTTGTLTVESATLAENGHEYRAIFSNSAGITTGNPATLTVSEHTEAPEVIHEPASITVWPANLQLSLPKRRAYQHPPCSGRYRKMEDRLGQTLAVKAPNPSRWCWNTCWRYRVVTSTVPYSRTWLAKRPATSSRLLWIRRPWSQPTRLARLCWKAKQ